MNLNEIEIPKFCIGPMSKRTMDAVQQFSVSTGNCIWFIPSRRQIEYNGGYVGNLKTKNLGTSMYRVTNKIMRDHGGPNQGKENDFGLVSLAWDSAYLDGIHIDPWKKYQNIYDAANHTVKLINFCYFLNPHLFFEIGTEQAIRELSVDEMRDFILCVQTKLKPKVFDRILYFVIQSGTSLRGNNNTGTYSRIKLLEMVNLCKNFGFKSKEHNGDYLSKAEIKDRFDNGLDTLNIAPEFGYLESKFILENIKNDDRYDIMFNACLESGKWKKWVQNDFDPNQNKDELILISGHYVFSNPIVKSNIINTIDDYDYKVKRVLELKLRELYD